MFEQMLVDVDAFYSAPENRHLLPKRQQNYLLARDMLATIMPLEEAVYQASRIVRDFYAIRQKHLFFRFKYFDSAEVSFTLDKE